MTDALAHALPEAPDVVRTRVLVVSATPGMAEMVARNVGRGDGSLIVRHARQSLADLAAAGPVADTDLVIFGVRPGDDADVAALRHLRAAHGDSLKFLGLTDVPLSLAVARGLMEAGLDEVMPLAAAAPRLIDATGMAPVAEETQTRRGGTARDGLIVAVAAARGGLGATGFALNLATLLVTLDKAARRGGNAMPRVAIVDLDVQNGVLGASIDVADTGAVLEMLQTGAHPDHDLLTRAMVTHDLGFDVMPAPDRIAPLDAMTPAMAAVLLDELRLAYDVVILDLPRAVTDWTAPVLARTDRLFLLTDPTVHTVRQTRRMLDLFRDDNPSLPVEAIVATGRKPLSPPPHVREAERFLDLPLRHWLPRDARAAARAGALGLPLVRACPRSPVARAMAPLVADLRAARLQTRRRRS